MSDSAIPATKPSSAIPEGSVKSNVRDYLQIITFLTKFKVKKAVKVKRGQICKLITEKSLQMTEPFHLLTAFFLAFLAFRYGYTKGLKKGRYDVKKNTAKSEAQRAKAYADKYRLLQTDEEEVWWQLRYQSYADGLRDGLGSSAAAKSNE